MEFVVSAK